MIKLKDITDLDFPVSLHNKIMRKVYFIKFRLPLFSLIIIASINLINSGWHLFNKTLEMESFTIMRTMLEQFDFSFDYLKSFWQTAIENIPLTSMFSFIINIILVYYLLIILKYFKRSKQTFDNKKLYI